MTGEQSRAGAQMSLGKKIRKLYNRVSEPIAATAQPPIGRVTDFIIFLKPVLPNVIIVLIGGAALNLTQGKDVLTNIGYSPLTQRVWFLGAIFLTGLCAWFWTRMITNDPNVIAKINRLTNVSHTIFFKEESIREDFNFSQPKENKFYQYYFPLFLGLCPFIFAFIALVRLNQRGGEVPIAIFGTLTVLALILLTIAITEYRAKQGHEPRLLRSDKVISADRTAVWTASAIGLSLLVWLAFTFSKYTIPQFIGPGGLAFGAFALLISAFSVFVILSHYSKLPIIAIFAAVYFLSDFKWKGWDATHEIRTVEGEIVRIEKMPIEKAFDRWLESREGHLRECEDHEEQQSSSAGSSQSKYCLPILFVSVTGGASRAGYFSQSVLTHLEEVSGFNLHKNIFSISAVSGGALGAVSYSAALQNRSRNLEPSVTNYSSDRFAKDLAKFNGDDFLSPTITGLLYRDPVDDLSLRVFHHLGYDDRSVVLEKAFERSWFKLYGPSTSDYSLIERVMRERAAADGNSVPFMLSDPFMELFPISIESEQQWFPALMLVGTHQETGKRILTGHIDPPDNVDILDLHDLTLRDVRASTAIMNSARFPIVSPPGAIVRDEEFFGHILDGGYFEGDGIETSLDIFADVVLAFKALKANSENELSIGVKYQDIRLEPIFIEINSDDTQPAPDKMRCYSDSCEIRTENPSVDGPSFLNEVLGPLTGLLSTRGGRGVLGAKRVSERIAKFTEFEREDVSPQYIQFDLCQLGSKESKERTAVSWSLSEISKARIDTILFDAPLNPPAHLIGTKKLDRMRWHEDAKNCVSKNRESAAQVLRIIKDR